MSASWTIYLCGGFVAVSVFLQARELLLLQYLWKKGGPWDWALVRAPLAKALPKAIDYIDLTMSDHVFNTLLFLQMFFAMVLLAAPNSLVAFACVLLEVLIALRFRGNLAGASDSMKIYLLMAVGLGRLPYLAPYFQPLVLLFIGFISAWSYFFSGLTKFKHPSWRNGQAVKKILLTMYANADFQKFFLKPEWLIRAGWGILVFELSVPLALFIKPLLFFWLAAALGFHFINTMALGLHRFFWVWLSTFPAMIYFSTLIAGLF